MIKFPMVSIVIITHNNGGLLKRCLESVFNTNYPNFEIIVADSASNDGTEILVTDLAKVHPNLKYVRLPEDLGVTVAYNIGFDKAKGKYIYKLDDDAIVEPDSLIELVKVMESDQSVGSAQSRALEYYRFNNHLEYFGYDIDYLGLFYQKTSCREVTDIFFPIFFSVITKKEIFYKVGKFDPLQFIYFDEVDFGWKVRLLGYRNVLVPSSRVRHLGPKKGIKKGHALFKLYHTRKNHMAVLLSNYELKNAIKYTILYVALLILKSCFKLFNKDTSSIISTLNALLWNLKHMKQIYQKRYYVQHHVRKVTDNEVMKYMIRPRLSAFFYS